MGLYPGARIQVVSSDSRGALVKLFSGQADMAIIARDVAADEKTAAKEGGADLRVFRIAIDGIAFIAHPENPVEGLSLEQAAGLLDGRLRSWAEVGGEDLPVIPVLRDRNSGTYEVVREKALGGSEFTEGPFCRSTQEVIDRVASNRASIGCAGLAWLGRGRVKALQIAEAPDSAYLGPTASSVYRNRYPVRRPILACVINYQTESTPRAGFLTFLTSSRGQTVVEMEGLVPNKVPDRIVQLD